MQVSVKRTGWLPVALPAIVVLSLFGAPARAQDTRSLGQKVVRDKILHDSGDRYDVKFLTTNTQHIGVRWVRVSGRGNFHRRGKPLQLFTYHVNIDPRTKDSAELGYSVH